MNIIIIGINYAPEMVGIGPYTAGMAQFLAARGYNVTVICAKPYYPQWKVDPDFSERGRQISYEKGVRVVRVPTYVPTTPDGKRRLIHHASFTAHAEFAMLSEIRRQRPDVVIGIAPSLISMAAARHAARRTGAKLWLHIQDFEVEAAFATGLLKGNGLLGKMAGRFEKWAIEADVVSTISPQMCRKLVEKGVPPERVIEFRNWADVDGIKPTDQPSPYRKEWNIQRPHVALYSGNIANKQGIEIVVEAAHLLRKRKDLIFIICGNGPNRSRLMEQAKHLDNIQFHELQPRERLSDLLSMATLHLLPQIANAADLVLPSKLTNMLASGRPVVATAMQGTGLANEVEGCGLITTPENSKEFAEAIETILTNQALQEKFKISARAKAVALWSMDEILNSFEKVIENLK